MKIVRAVEEQKVEILSLHEKAFGESEGEVISQLVANLLRDKTAEPLYSFVALEGEKLVGHILFTKVTVSGADEKLSAQLLAPLAVLPEYQGRGIGTKLIDGALEELRREGVTLVLVLGHPEYYPRCGFINDAGKLGFEAPYPIAAKNADAWMVQELSPGLLGSVKGRVQPADVWKDPQYWCE